MFFVGHIAIAFLLTYLISLKYPDITKTVSISLVMFLSILPDVDMVFRFAGIDFGHRTITHSGVTWLMVGAVILCMVPRGRGYERGSLGIYLIAYLSHIFIGDTLVAPINIFHPLGEFVIHSSILVGSSFHIVIEGMLLALMAAIVITKYYSYNRSIRNKDGNHKNDYSDFLFRYHHKLDGLFYPVLISAIAVSLFYLSYEFEFSILFLTSFGNDVNEIGMQIILLHLAVIPIVTLMWLTSKGNRSVSKHPRQDNKL